MSTEKLSETPAPEASIRVAPIVAGETSPNTGMVVVQGDEYVQHGRPQRQSHLCCGCCCDTRRAVIVVNIISMSFAAIAIFSLSMVTSDGYASQFDDDEVQAALNEIDGTSVGVAIGITCLGIICSAAGLFGAFKFNNIAIMVAAVWYCAECIRSLVFYNLGGAIMAGFFAYPHFVFYQEMKKGIMTPANYPNEEQCCGCCV